jgi:cell division ATPase FtsA
VAVGLDIGTTKIAMIGKKNEYGKLEIWESVNLKV